jgi:hypothetical protein
MNSERAKMGGRKPQFLSILTYYLYITTCCHNLMKILYLPLMVSAKNGGNM